MNIALYSKGYLGKKAYEYIEATDGLVVVCLCEDRVTYGNSNELVFAEAVSVPTSLATVDVNELASMYSAGTVDAIIVATDNEVLDYVVRRLARTGIRDIAVLPSYYEENYDITDDSFMWVEADKPRLSYVEYHISYHCNLKCAGCTHFSNIINDERFGDYDSFCRDMVRLQELFWGIGKIRLMGGEPLLNPRLSDFIYAARAAFPDADIRVVSNGLLLRDDDTDVLSAMRDTATYFDVSMYPPTAGMIDNIYRICSKNGVKLTVTSDIEEFTAGMNPDGDSNPKESYAACPSNHCIYMCEGRISTCVMPQVIDIYNDRFEQNIRPGANDTIDLYEEGLDGDELIRRLKLPMEICRYCDATRRAYKWFVSTKPKPDEWVAKATESDRG